MLRLSLVACCVLLCACRNAPAPPMTDPPARIETVSGAESLGWDQAAADVVELAGIGHVIYVDGVRASLAGVACAPVATTTGFSCSARLPALAAGPHTIELASFVNEGELIESARSSPLHIVVMPSSAAAFGGDFVGGGSSVTAEGVGFRVEPVIGGLAEAVDLAFTPDGRLLVAERQGTIRVVRDVRLAAEPAIALADTLGANGRLLAIAVDPQFERSRHVFALYTAPSRPGGLAFVLARFREVADTLGDRAVLLDAVPASADPRGSLRFGPDEKLYVAFDDGGDARRAGDAASPNGKILRLNADGTTPRDQDGGTPVHLDGQRSPRGLDWDPRSGALWAADGAADGSGLLRSAVGRSFRGVYALPPPTDPSSMAFYNGSAFPLFANSLLVASESAGHLLRLRVDPPGSPPVAADYLLERVTGGVRSVVIGPRGVIHFATRSGVGRLVPTGR